MSLKKAAFIAIPICLILAGYAVAQTTNSANVQINLDIIGAYINIPSGASVTLYQQGSGSTIWKGSLEDIQFCCNEGSGFYIEATDNGGLKSDGNGFAAPLKITFPKENGNDMGTNVDVTGTIAKSNNYDLNSYTGTFDFIQNVGIAPVPGSYSDQVIITISPYTVH